MMKIGAVGAGLLLGLGTSLALGQSEDKLSRQAAVVRPRPEEVKWQKIPWIVDLAEGQRLAQAERRPIFLWATAAPTLERC